MGSYVAVRGSCFIGSFLIGWLPTLASSHRRNGPILIHPPKKDKLGRNSAKHLPVIHVSWHMRQSARCTLLGRAGAAAVALPDRTACRGGALSLRLGSARHVLLCPSMQTTSSRRCVRGIWAVRRHRERTARATRSWPVDGTGCMVINLVYHVAQFG
jgi:hypothetical protein